MTIIGGSAATRSRTVPGSGPPLSASASSTANSKRARWRCAASACSSRGARWSNDAGNETELSARVRIGDDGRIAYEGRFDEDDFEGAYRELERRYYAGEGAAFAEAGAALTEYMVALNRADFDKAFGELTRPDLRLQNRSRSAFGDRSAAEFRASVENLRAMVASVREWDSAVCWLSPTWPSVATNAKPSGWTASGTHGLDFSSTRSATGGSRRRASSISRTRNARSRTPRSGCGRLPAGWRSPTAPARWDTGV